MVFSPSGRKKNSEQNKLKNQFIYHLCLNRLLRQKGALLSQVNYREENLEIKTIKT